MMLALLLGQPEPILPESNNLMFGLISVLVVLAPVVLVTFVVWQLVRIRQATERAAAAAERAAPGVDDGA